MEARSPASSLLLRRRPGAAIIIVGSGPRGRSLAIADFVFERTKCSVARPKQSCQGAGDCRPVTAPSTFLCPCSNSKRTWRSLLTSGRLRALSFHAAGICCADVTSWIGCSPYAPTTETTATIKIPAAHFDAVSLFHSSDIWRMSRWRRCTVSMLSLSCSSLDDRVAARVGADHRRFDIIFAVDLVDSRRKCRKNMSGLRLQRPTGAYCVDPALI